MLPPFIIEQIREREERERRHAPQPYLELPVPMRAPATERRESPEDRDRGVVIIDLMAD